MGEFGAGQWQASGCCHEHVDQTDGLPCAQCGDQAGLCVSAKLVRLALTSNTCTNPCFAPQNGSKCMLTVTQNKFCADGESASE